MLCPGLDCCARGEGFLKCWLRSFGVQWWKVIWLRTQLMAHQGQPGFPGFDQKLPAVIDSNKDNRPCAHGLKLHWSFWISHVFKLTAMIQSLVSAYLYHTSLFTFTSLSDLDTKRTPPESRGVSFIRLAADTEERYDPPWGCLLTFIELTAGLWSANLLRLWTADYCQRHMESWNTSKM